LRALQTDVESFGILKFEDFDSSATDVESFWYFEDFDFIGGWMLNAADENTSRVHGIAPCAGHGHLHRKGT
jgi:hypothetical protein